MRRAHRSPSSLLIVSLRPIWLQSAAAEGEQWVLWHVQTERLHCCVLFNQELVFSPTLRPTPQLCQASLCSLCINWSVQLWRTEEKGETSQDLFPGLVSPPGRHMSGFLHQVCTHWFTKCVTVKPATSETTKDPSDVPTGPSASSPSVEAGMMTPHGRKCLQKCINHLSQSALSYFISNSSALLVFHS